MALREDIDLAADWIATALIASGYTADFTPASLSSIDRFVADHSRRGKPRRRGLLAQDTGQRLFALGAYVGEVIRRAVGGEWQADDGDPQGEINASLHLPNGSTIWPIQRVMKRYALGDEESISDYGSVLIAAN